jgi:hypothetical protein
MKENEKSVSLDTRETKASTAAAFGLVFGSNSFALDSLGSSSISKTNIVFHLSRAMKKRTQKKSNLV